MVLYYGITLACWVFGLDLCFVKECDLLVSGESRKPPAECWPTKVRTGVPKNPTQE